PRRRTGANAAHRQRLDGVPTPPRRAGDPLAPTPLALRPGEPQEPARSLLAARRPHAVCAESVGGRPHPGRPGGQWPEERQLGCQGAVQDAVRCRGAKARSLDNQFASRHPPGGAGGTAPGSRATEGAPAEPTDGVSEELLSAAVGTVRRSGRAPHPGGSPVLPQPLRLTAGHPRRLGPALPGPTLPTSASDPRPLGGRTRPPGAAVSRRGAVGRAPGAHTVAAPGSPPRGARSNRASDRGGVCGASRRRLFSFPPRRRTRVSPLLA